MTDRRVIVTGSRSFEERDFVFDVLAEVYTATLIAGRWDALQIVHGAARGADTLADVWVRRYREKRPSWLLRDPEPHPPKTDLYGASALTMRNEEMAVAGADLCVGFGYTYPATGGTHDMLCRANSYGIETHYYRVGKRRRPEPRTLLDVFAEGDG